MMSLDQLRVFIAVAEREHLTRAAQSLRLTQSAVSAAIAALEEAYSVRLFDRIGRNIKLTSDGALFLNKARQVFEKALEAESLLSNINNLKTGALRLAASQTIGNYWLPPFLDRFQRQYKGVTLSLFVGNTEQVLRQVKNDNVDLGFVEGVVSDKCIQKKVVATDQLVAFVGAIHPLAKKKSTTSSDLLVTPWILREPGSGTRALAEKLLTQNSVSINDVTVSMELPINEAICSAVASGHVAGILSSLAIQNGITSKALVKLPLNELERVFYLIQLNEKKLTKAATEFTKLFSGRN